MPLRASNCVTLGSAARLAALVPLLVCLLAPARVHALSCEDPLTALPARGSEAPLNTRVWLRLRLDGLTLRWIDEELGPVAFRERRIPLPGPDLVVLTPDAPLAASSSYRVEMCGGVRPAGCHELTHFRTSAVIDEQVPALPVARETGSYAERDDTWGDTQTVSFSVQADSVIVADVDGAGGSSPFEEGAELGAFSSDEHLSIGEGPCLPATFEAAQAKVRFGTFDLAGNFSGYTEPVLVTKPPLPLDCSVGSAHGGWMVLLALTLAVRRRYSASMP